MAEVQKYLFDTQFDAPPPAPEPEPLPEIPSEPPPPPPPVFSEAELETARGEAYARGLREGQSQGRSEALSGQERLQVQLLDAISLRLAELMSEQAARFVQGREMILQIALTITRKLLPDHVSRHGLSEIEAQVQTVLGELGGEPRLVVRVHDSLLDTVTIKLQQEADRRGYAGKIVFLADAGMGPSDCKIEWADGGLERDTARLWGEIDRVVAQVLQAGPVVSLSGSGSGRETTTSIEG